GRPFTWSEELARYMLVWIVYLFAVIAFRLSRHMGIDFFVLLLSDRFRGIVQGAGDVLIFGFLILVLRFGTELVGITLPQTSAALGIPMGLVYLAFPVSAGLMALELLFRLYSRLTGGRR
ncbi:MAG TPA: TRAP transporter small permease, partial [Spirochaetia bacterium]|nr:TRAP transporter small permease [Spirochaetia bacterium]